VFYEYNSGAAIQDDSMKLVRSKEWELYDLSKDRTETSNLIAQYPELAQDLLKQWNAWYTECTSADYADVAAAIKDANSGQRKTKTNKKK
jgi:arylsulfatase